MQEKGGRDNIELEKIVLMQIMNKLKKNEMKSLNLKSASAELLYSKCKG